MDHGVPSLLRMHRFPCLRSWRRRSEYRILSAMVTRLDEVDGLRVRVAEDGVRDATSVLMTGP